MTGSARNRWVLAVGMLAAALVAGAIIAATRDTSTLKYQDYLGPAPTTSGCPQQSKSASGWTCYGH
ncbi:MAG: hypothetical protein ABI140_02280 [Jatrophihabitantaceae bacterium]